MLNYLGRRLAGRFNFNYLRLVILNRNFLYWGFLKESHNSFLVEFLLVLLVGHYALGSLLLYLVYVGSQPGEPYIFPYFLVLL